MKQFHIYGRFMQSNRLGYQRAHCLAGHSRQQKIRSQWGPHPGWALVADGNHKGYDSQGQHCRLPACSGKNVTSQYAPFSPYASTPFRGASWRPPLFPSRPWRRTGGGRRKKDEERAASVSWPSLASGQRGNPPLSPDVGPLRHPAWEKRDPIPKPRNPLRLTPPTSTQPLVSVNQTTCYAEFIQGTCHKKSWRVTLVIQWVYSNFYRPV